jgi:hypothetical protein
VIKKPRERGGHSPRLATESEKLLLLLLLLRYVMEAAEPSETTVLFYQTARRVIQIRATTIVSAVVPQMPALGVTVSPIGLLSEFDIEN